MRMIGVISLFQTSNKTNTSFLWSKVLLLVLLTSCFLIKPQQCLLKSQLLSGEKTLLTASRKTAMGALFSRQQDVTAIGLTGGIASGKSTVRSCLEAQGAYVIDADKLGHQSYEPGQKAYQQLREIFGDSIINEDQTINRKALGGIVFSDKAEMKKLEAAVWPCIKEMIVQEIRTIKERHQGGPTAVVVVEAAVLLEAGWDKIMDRIWVCAIEPGIARPRLMARNGLTAEEADKRIGAQMANTERVAKADRVIWNNGTLEELEAQVLQLWKEDFPALANITQS